MVLNGYKLSESLHQSIVKSEVPLNEIYWIIKNIYNEVEKLYIEQLQKEIKEEESKNDGMVNEQLS